MIGDIMKALQGMGDGFRRRVADVAQRFQQV
jgi:hypothetical protein